ncbi:MAG TPA: hypothetical protein VF743_01975 [Acidimicrobiales bacterium]
MSPVLARKMWRTLEPYHGMIYFTPRATEAYAAMGITGQAGYFASRAAPLGAVPAEVVIATFYNFDPSVVRAAIPDAWQCATPEAIVAARFGAADAALRELLGDDALASDEMAEAADLAARAAAACPPEGRPLFAAHTALAWPAEPHLALWHAVTLLREFRGDGHVAALLLAGVDPCEALLTHGAAGDNDIALDLLKATRGWSDDDWDAARARLRDRGWLDEEDALTADGAAARQRIEDLTDERAMTPWVALGQERADRLRALVRPWSRAIATTGVFGGAGGRRAPWVGG